MEKIILKQFLEKYVHKLPCKRFKNLEFEFRNDTSFYFMLLFSLLCNICIIQEVYVKKLSIVYFHYHII